MRLSGSTTLITGGTGALGRVVAERFLGEGSNVATSYRSEEELKSLSEEFRKKVFAVRADVTGDEEVELLFRRVIGKFGRVDILINIVGGYLPGSSVKDVMTKDWDRMMDMNLKSVFLCSRTFLRNIGKASYGRIISMAAMPALRPAAGKAPYAVSKSGVVMLTQILAEELKGTGVTANAIAPSIIRTQANVESMPGEDHSRWVAPGDIAGMMVTLCSEEGGSVNGACIPLFGGV
jgi:NAD(P)-dependent dehydrogenase (short-subunit alcohol dehydrogenase family)